MGSSDPWIARLGVAFLGIVALASAIGGAAISYGGHDIPPYLAGIGSSAVSTLGVIVMALTRPAGPANGKT